VAVNSPKPLIVPDEVYLALGRRFQYGQERGYARDNWRLIPAEEHFNHMFIHYLAIRKGDTSDDHFGAFICRAAMCFYTLLQERSRTEEQAVSVRPADIRREQLRETFKYLESKGLLTVPCEIAVARTEEGLKKCAGYMPPTSMGLSQKTPGQESETLIL